MLPPARMLQLSSWRLRELLPSAGSGGAPVWLMQARLARAPVPSNAATAEACRRFDRFGHFALAGFAAAPAGSFSTSQPIGATICAYPPALAPLVRYLPLTSRVGVPSTPASRTICTARESLLSTSNEADAPRNFARSTPCCE